MIFFGSALAHLEPKLELFEVWEFGRWCHWQWWWSVARLSPIYLLFACKIFTSGRPDPLLWLLSRRRRGCIFIIKTKIKQLQFPTHRAERLFLAKVNLAPSYKKLNMFQIFYILDFCLPMYDMHFTLGQGASSWESFGEQKITSKNIFQPQIFLFTTNALFCVYVQN